MSWHMVSTVSEVRSETFPSIFDKHTLENSSVYILQKKFSVQPCFIFFQL